MCSSAAVNLHRGSSTFVFPAFGHGFNQNRDYIYKSASPKHLLHAAALLSNNAAGILYFPLFRQTGRDLIESKTDSEGPVQKCAQTRQLRVHISALQLVRSLGLRAERAINVSAKH